jgi:SAM-dependent methyltransferase
MVTMSDTETAIERWRRDLASWAIPDEIRDAAPAFPYRLDPALFAPVDDDDADPNDSLAYRRAADALPTEGTVLDIGCGGGAASLALSAAATVIGVDESAEMLEQFSRHGRARGLVVHTVHGRWPEAEQHVASLGPADIVVCHHVAYNVPDLDRFVLALNRCASRRVVMELTLVHPQTVNTPLWHRFWDLDRPTAPTADDAFAVIAEAGIDATLEIGAAGRLRHAPPWKVRVESAARFLCLGPDRLGEVEAALAELPDRSDDRAVIWWDVG